MRTHHRWISRALIAVTSVALILAVRGGDVPVVKSALTRGILDTNPTVYWPLESRTLLAEVGGSTLVEAGQIQYQSQTGNPASGPLPDFTGGGSLIGPLPPGTTTDQWRLEFVARFGTGSDTIADSEFTVPVQLGSPNGTVNIWEVLISSGTAILQWSDTSGGYTGLLDSTIAVDDGLWHHFRIDVAQSGVNISANITVDGKAATPSTLASKTLNSTDSTIFINPLHETASYVGSVGHLAYWAPYTSSTNTVTIAQGYAGETAATRFARLCTENSIAYTVST